MKTLTRKEQNFLDREKELIALAMEIMHKDGVSSLTMDKLTAQSDFSKGTIYNHFSCKEDILSAISITSLAELNPLFSRAVRFKGTTRERLLAVNFAYMLKAKLNPEQFMCVLSCKTSSVTEKASKQRRQLSIDKENEILSILNQLVKEAEMVGELVINPSQNSQLITFCNWSMSFGTLALLMHVEDSQVTKSLDLQEAFLSNINITLDGLGWKPLSSQWDYNDTIKRIEKEIFSAELQLISNLDLS
ncbi:MAG: TetR/AcrR family transcriptional regulator [Epsilonproteobacteria bacterium]|nr:MAG: TetR/AcrR family transcriptional regulator [Campylobacterota bacterium]